MKNRRVVVTGMGLITPLGIGLEQNWEAIMECRSGIGPITKIDASDLDTKIAGEVKNFDPLEFLDRKEVKRTDPFIQYALAASQLAVEHAGIQFDGTDADRVGVLIGSGIGGLQTIEQYHSVLLERGPSKVTPFFIPMVIINLAAGQVAIRFGAKGPCMASVTACAAGTNAIGDAFRIIQRGEADVMICGGTEAVLTRLVVSGFNAMRALSTRNDDPQKASRPFDARRDGFVIAEGAGILILEEMGRALRRDARPLAEIIGYGVSGDAYHISAPSENGEGFARCIWAALHDAEISPDEIDYINAHGTSTPLNDKYETLAIKEVFGDYARRLAVSSTKSTTGHMLGAAGGVEAIIGIMAMENNILPPTTNLEFPDPECDLDYVPNRPRERSINTVLSNSFGFGGTNATLILRSYE
ncbi:MAG: beta-ketoacyl-ACP synthase II [Deltaproteobacteria bacterium]|nr:beta-ketoacyl-ACP synthase II [Deltaproteobacteria bacterium]